MFSKFRLNAIFLVFAIFLSLVFRELFILQIIDNDENTQDIVDQNFETFYIPAPRGEILDINGNKLAESILEPYLFLNQKKINEENIAIYKQFISFNFNNLTNTEIDNFFSSKELFVEIANLNDYETDLRIKKVGIECNTQEAGYSDEYGQRFGMLEFGDYLKISNGSTEDAESFRIDVCPPSPLIEAYDCGGNITYSDVLSNLDSLTFDGFNTDLTAANLTIKHEHYVYGGCTRFNDPNADTPYDEALASVGFKFQDLNFGECFKVSKSSANTVNGGIGDCDVDIGLCGETEDVYVVCEVSCTNDGKTTSKQKLTFKDGLLKDVSGCGEAGTSEDKLEAVIENGSQAIVNTDTDLSNVFDGNSLVVYGTAALGSIILHLPPLALIGFAAITIFKADGTSNTVTVRPHSGETFANGDTSHVLTHTEESMQVVSNGLSLLRV